MALTDFLTGGGSTRARDAMDQSRRVIENVKVPTVEDLTIDDLQEYVVQGLITPAEAKAYLQEKNAFEGMDIDQTGTKAQMEALAQLSRVANAGSEGTAEEQAANARIMADMNRSVAGQRGAIEQAMAARGVPASLIQAALESSAVGEDATRANLAAMEARANTERMALDAMTGRANVGSNLQAQQNAQANTAAQAANAMQQFNAQNQTAVSEANTGRRERADTQNLGMRQDVSDRNVAQENARRERNANVKQQIFEDEMQRATGASGAYQGIAGLGQAQGRQEAGLIGGILGTIAKQGRPSGTPTGAAHGMIADLPNCDEGGVIPGEPEVMGDSTQNDKVHAMVSPGEAVLPRTAVMRHMPEVLSMLSESREEPDVTPEDLAKVIMAMKSIRMEAARG